MNRAGYDGVSWAHIPQSRQLVTWKKPVMIVKILFSLITIIPRKVYKVHSILKSGKGGERRRGSRFGLEGSSVDSNKGSPAGLGEVGRGGLIVKKKTCGSV